jgi:muconate cycloisomerase
MRIVRLEIYRIRIPFKRKYVHAEADRSETESVIVRLRTAGGITGVGETIPRPYLTGETPASAMDVIEKTFAPRIVGHQFPGFFRVVEFLADMVGTAHERLVGAAFCAVDLATLDVAGKYFMRPASDAIGGLKRRKINYTAPVSGEGRWVTARTALKLRLTGFSQLKVKVGVGDDEARLALVRRIVGRRADIRIDANCAWRPEEAVEKIRAMKRYNVSSVEQPVEGRDFEGMRYVRQRCGIPVMADESACTFGDARLLAEMGGCDILNVRLAKCGGMTGSMMMVEIARERSLACQLGCLVGETSILGAAGRHFALAVPDLIHVEGSYNRYLLRNDIAVPRMGFGPNGIAHALGGYGLGVRLDETALADCTIEKRVVGS